MENKHLDDQSRGLVREEIERMLAEKGHTHFEIAESHHLEADLGLGSLDLVNLLTVIDVRLGRDLSKQPPLALKTVGDLYQAYSSRFDIACSPQGPDPVLRAARARGIARRRF